MDSWPQFTMTIKKFFFNSSISSRLASGSVSPETETSLSGLTVPTIQPRIGQPGTRSLDRIVRMLSSRRDSTLRGSRRLALIH
ncbi:hypothetical protein PENTCL1PPCAC_13757 [Pristionchus entomophagus]|uniref:Uncharacterized protein n=1 Tax=Pristionchus entomophagus TaxID=358040 RepID=A0AAV5T9H6_9BILA|nr:hypothetical protein PENTCL1PPCAC_13757 [Pristionchus entomophagus]